MHGAYHGPMATYLPGGHGHGGCLTVSQTPIDIAKWDKLIQINGDVFLITTSAE